MKPKVTDIMMELYHRVPALKAGDQSLIAVFHAMVDTFQKNGILYLCGNGGSFADVIHIKGELGKQFEMKRPLRQDDVLHRLEQHEDGSLMIETLEVGLPVVVLGESHALRSAFENDKDPALSYAQELLSFIHWVRPGIFMGLSTSGNARNVNLAAALAKAYGLTTIGFTGPKGGTLAQQADIAWRVPGETTANIQEHQIALYHALCKMIEAHFFDSEQPV